MNATDIINASNATGNETIKQAANQAGSFAVDKLLNQPWADGVASWLNATLGQTVFSGPLVSALVPLISLALLYWKWGAIISFVDNFGKFLLILAALYLVLHATGVV